MSKAKYPKTLIHPGYAPAEISTSGIPGAPARFPPVIVHDADQEEEYCAKGYAPGELIDAPIRWLEDSPDKSTAAPPALSQQQFDQKKFEAILERDPVAQARLEERKDAAEIDAQHGIRPIMQVLEIITWPKLKRLLLRGKARATCRVEWADGSFEHRNFDPAWLECLSKDPRFGQPDAGVLWLDQRPAGKIRPKVPVRVSDIAVEIAGHEQVWPRAIQCGGEPVAASRDATKHKKGRGRNPGDGAKNDEAELGSMLRLIAENKVTSPNAAALKIIEESRARGEKLARHAHRRLSKKFLDKYRSQRRDGETWGDCCRRIAHELQSNRVE